MQDASALERPLIGPVFYDGRHTRPFVFTVRYGALVQDERFYSLADAHAARHDLIAASVGAVIVRYGDDVTPFDGPTLAHVYPLLLHFAAALNPGESRSLATCTDTPVVVERYS